MDHNWHYGEASPEFGKADEFKACIAGSADSRKSAAAWLVYSSLRQASPVVKTSDGISTSQRAVLAALIGVLESLPSGSSVCCYTTIPMQ